MNEILTNAEYLDELSRYTSKLRAIQNAMQDAAIRPMPETDIEKRTRVNTVRALADSFLLTLDDLSEFQAHHGDA